MNKRRIVFICFLIFVSVFTIVNLPSVFAFTNNSNINAEAETLPTDSSATNPELENSSTSSLNTNTEQTTTPSTNNELSLTMPDGCDYYAISTPAELDYLSQNINSYRNSKIVLTADLDLSDYSTWKPIGYNNENIFNGTFDGNGYKISNLNVSDYDYAGLFGYLGSAAEIKNLIIENPTIESSLYAGALAGYSTYYYGSATIDNIKVINPNIKATSSSSVFVGGIIGYKNGGIISNCIVLKDSNISCVIKSTVTESFAAYAGGIVGCFNKTGTIDLCANNVDVTTNSPFSSLCGGIVGWNNDKLIINKSYNTGNITAENNKMNGNLNYVGGIVGRHDAGQITDCFNNGIISSNAVYTKQSQTDISPENTDYYNWENRGRICFNDNLEFYRYLTNNSYISKEYKLKNVGGIAGYSNATILNSYNNGIVDKSEIDNTMCILFDYSGYCSNNMVVLSSNSSSKTYPSNSSSSSSSNSSSNSSISPEPAPDSEPSYSDNSSSEGQEHDMNIHLSYTITYTENIQTEIAGSVGSGISINNCYCSSFDNITNIQTKDSGFKNYTLATIKNHSNLQMYADFTFEQKNDNTFELFVETNDIDVIEHNDHRGDEYSYGWASNLAFAKFTIQPSAEYSIMNVGVKNISNLDNIVNSSSSWEVQPKINNGNPYLKDFYWSSISN